jgi:hypothetical protein
MFIQNLTLLACKNHCAYSKNIICIHFKIYHRKPTVFLGHNMVPSATRPEQNMILSFPVQKHKIKSKLNGNGNAACCLAIVVTWTHTFLCFNFYLSRGQGTVCVPLQHAYRAFGKQRQGSQWCPQ